VLGGSALEGGDRLAGFKGDTCERRNSKIITQHDAINASQQEGFPPKQREKEKVERIVQSRLASLRKGHGLNDFKRTKTTAQMEGAAKTKR